jgi:hypothetical protein
MDFYGNRACPKASFWPVVIGLLLAIVVIGIAALRLYRHPPSSALGRLAREILVWPLALLGGWILFALWYDRLGWIGVFGQAAIFGGVLFARRASLRTVRLNSWQRLWVLVSLLFAAVVLCGSYILWPEPPQQPTDYDALAKQSGGRMSAPDVAASIRERFPSAYDDMTDAQLEAAVVSKLVREAYATDAARAAAVNAYRQSNDSDELTAKLNGLPVPVSLKADLCDLKSGQVPATVFQWETETAARTLAVNRRRFIAIAASVWAATVSALYALG